MEWSSLLRGPFQQQQKQLGVALCAGTGVLLGIGALRTYLARAAAAEEEEETRLRVEDVQVSIVIPALNEEASLPRILTAVLGQAPKPRDVIVVDAGSADSTAEVARAAGATVISSMKKGRAWQMNAGAEFAKGDVLLFLHADTELLPGALLQVQRAMRDKKKIGGCFRLRFYEESQSCFLRFSGWTTHTWFLNRPRFTLGDRAIFARKSAFEAIKGFSEIPLMEDPDFALRLATYGGGPSSMAYLRQHVVTSGRRFLESGPIRQQLRNCYIFLLWHLGYTPEQLRHMYRPRRPSR